jgi:hypothetical protein
LAKVPALPPKGFAARPLVLHSPAADETWLRLYRRTHADPLGFGKGPSRFSDPRPLPAHGRYGVVYLGSSLKVGVLEAIVRDRGDARLGDLVIGRRELEETSCAEVVCGPNLRLADLRGDGAVQMGVPTDAVRASDQALGQAWALAFQQHDVTPDGLIYSSRLNGEDNIALFDRAIPKVRVASVGPLLDRRTELAAVIRTLGLAIL